MTAKAQFWNVVLVLLSAVNVAAVWFAARPGEAWHATTHGALALGFGLWAQHRIRQAPSREPALTGITDQRLDRIETAIDAVALEVERIGEMERFASKFLAGRAETLGADTKAPDRVEAQPDTNR